MNRATRKIQAEETVAIVNRGTYQSPTGRTVNITREVQACLDATRSYSAEEVRSTHRVGLTQPSGPATTRFEVVNETTLAGVERILGDGAESVAALNFASARNPGGGFLNGSLAQEESLAISSALYASQLQAPEFYDRHRQASSLLYSDAMILSPDCPIFRDDSGQLRDEPILATFLTSPAPNAGAITAQRSKEQAEVAATLRERAELILALAASAGLKNLVLGAWGCGVFRNDPAQVAAAFADPLHAGVWSGQFDRVVFAVLDHSASQATFRAFEQVFR